MESKVSPAFFITVTTIDLSSVGEKYALLYRLFQSAFIVASHWIGKAHAIVFHAWKAKRKISELYSTQFHPLGQCTKCAADSQRVRWNQSSA